MSQLNSDDDSDNDEELAMMEKVPPARKRNDMNALLGEDSD